MMTFLWLLGIFLTLGSLPSLTVSEDNLEIMCNDIVCDEYECPYYEDCDFGEVQDVCQCCYTCAKGPGENCGGMYDLAGRCGIGYDCQPHPKYPQLPGICIE